MKTIAVILAFVTGLWGTTTMTSFAGISVTDSLITSNKKNTTTVSSYYETEIYADGMPHATFWKQQLYMRAVKFRFQQKLNDSVEVLNGQYHSKDLRLFKADYVRRNYTKIFLSPKLDKRDKAPFYFYKYERAAIFAVHNERSGECLGEVWLVPATLMYEQKSVIYF